MVEDGIRRAQEELAKPIMLDLEQPYGGWGGFYEQFGRKFRKDSLTLIDPDAPILPQLEMVNVRKPRMEITWKKREYFIQDGWLYDRATWEAVKLNAK
jgi:hypothetical protein